MKDVKGTQTLPLVAANLSGAFLMKEAERRKMGERIRELRAVSPYSQRQIARKLKISPRMYQKNEERGTTKWDRVQKIARIHKADPYEIWTGEKRPATPRLTGRMDERLNRIEEKLDQVLDALDAEAAVRDVDDVDRGKRQSDPLPALEPASNAKTQAGERRRAARQ